ncbi:MAG: EamA family transporter [candidate division Zixibacteria bacterium]|nr:EamA family transporter [candidate division Zixibacteria bacterium]
MHTTPPTYKRVLADMGLFYSAAIWGSTFFIVKAVLNDIDPVILVGYRFMLAGLILLVYVLYSGRSLTKNLGRATFLGALIWLLYIPQTIGLKYTTASNSGFITGLFVAFVPFFLRVIFRRRPTRAEVLASAVSLVGLWILTGGMKDVNIGDMLTLIAAMTYALHVLYSDKFMKERVDPYVISCQQFLVVGVLSLLTGLLFDLPFGVKSTAAIWTVLFLALFPTLLAFLIQMLAQRITAPMKVSLIFALEPVFAALFAWTLGGEQFVTHRALGGLLIFAALVISGISPTIRKRKDSVLT